MKRGISILVVAIALLLGSISWAAEPDAARNSLQSARELYASGDWETAKEAYEAAYDGSSENSVMKAEAALEWGSLLWEQGRYPAAEKRVRDALKRAKKLELDHAIGRLMLTLGHIEASRGRLSDAESTLKICSRLADQQKDKNFAALCRINLRLVRQLRGRNPGPETRYRKDLNMLKASGEDLLVGTALSKTAELYAKVGQYGVAEQYLQNAHSHFEKAGSVPAQARNRLKKAQLYQDQQKWDAAARQLDGLVLRFRNMRNDPSLATAYLLAARQSAHEGKATEANSFYDKALATSKKVNSPQLIGNAHLARCEYYANTQNEVAARKACRQAQTIFQQTGVPELAARSRIVLARMAHARQDYQTARSHYLSIIEALESRTNSPDSRRTVAIQRVNLCQVELELEANGTLARCREAVDALKKLKASDDDYHKMLAMSHYAAGMAAYRASDSKKARKHLQQAVENYDRVKANELAAEAYLRLGRLELRTNNRKAAREALERAHDLSLVSDVTKTETRQLRIQIPIQIAQLEMDDENWTAARDMAKKVVDRSEKFEDHTSTGWGYNALARAELKLKNTDAAVDALKKGIIAAKKSGDEELEKGLRENLEKFSR